MPDLIPLGATVHFVRANGAREGVVVGRYDRWLIVQCKPLGAPVLVLTGSCEAVPHAA